MSHDFSDAPLTVNGVTVRPTWAWSRQYRAHVADSMRATSKTDLTPRDREDRYVAWYAAHYGLTNEQARQRIEASL